MRVERYAKRARSRATKQGENLSLQRNIGLPRYTPSNKTAAEFHKRPEKVRFLFGGNRSSKTYTVSGEHVAIARKINNGKGIALTNSFKGVGLYLWPTYKKHIAPGEAKVISWISKQKEIPEIVKFIKSGYWLHFGSYEQGRENLQGTKWDIAHFDEESPEDIYKEVYRGTLDNKGRILGSMTPLKGKTYVYHEIFRKAATSKNIWCGTMSLLDNPYIPQEEKDAFIEMLSEKDRKARIDGDFVTFKGLVYGDFNPDVHVIDPFPVPSDWPIYRAIDFGAVDPTVSLVVAFDGTTFYVISEYVKNDCLIEIHAENMHKQHSDIVTTAGAGLLPFLDTVADHDKQERMQYAFQGIHSEPAEKDIWPGIEQVRSFMSVRTDGSTRVKIFRTCEHTIDELGKYSMYPEDKQTTAKKKREPMDQDNHCMDCLRYVVVRVAGYLHERIPEIISF